MKTLFNRNTRIAAFAAVVIVGLTGLTLDRGHMDTLPRGVIEVGELQPVIEAEPVIAQLPTVTVIGKRGTQLADVVGDDGAQG